MLVPVPPFVVETGVASDKSVPEVGMVTVVVPVVVIVMGLPPEVASVLDAAKVRVAGVAGVVMVILLRVPLTVAVVDVSVVMDALTIFTPLKVAVPTQLKLVLTVSVPTDKVAIEPLTAFTPFKSAEPETPISPVNDREVPLATPMLGVIRVGVLARTNAPLPVAVEPNAVCTLVPNVNEFIAEAEAPTNITPFATVVGKL